MTLELIDAETRLSKVSFQADEDWKIYPRSTYTCPHCTAQTSFALGDLEKHAFSDATNLTYEESAQSAAAAINSGRQWNSFIDFHCPGCERPVRICYTAWAGGRFTSGYEIGFVVEVAK